MEEHILIPTNDTQTPITEELLSQYPDEVREQFLDFISTVPYIANLISPSRPEVKDLPKDAQGRAIIDITNPPILRNTKWFSQVAEDYMKNDEVYTKLRPNSNPNSEYRKFWQREVDRIYDGYLREDGLWIPGHFYWELNYVPMLINEIKKGSKRAIRKVGFPKFFDQTFLRFRYYDDSVEDGNHGAELAKRGAGKSYFLAAIMSRNLLFGKSKDSQKRWTTVLTAYQKEYLKGDKDGTLSKFEPTLSHVFATTPFPHLTLKNSSNEMVWQMGYKNLEGAVDKRSSLNTVMGVSAKDDSDKLRGKRADILYEEFGNFNGLLELYDACRRGTEDGDFAFGTMFLVGCVCAGTKVWTPDGRNINIEELKKEDGIIGFTDSFETDYGVYLKRGATIEPITSDIIIGNKECVRITLSNGNQLECSVDHPILVQKHRCGHGRKYDYYEEVFRNAEDIKVGDRVLESRFIDNFGNSTLFDARLVGMLIGDGTYGSSVKYCSEDKELNDYVQSNYETKVFREFITKKGNNYQEYRVNGIRGKLNDIGILGQTKDKKRLPNNWETLSREDSILLLSGLYDTDGSVWTRKDEGYISLTQGNPYILEQVKTIWRKFGVVCSIVKTEPNIKEGRKDKNPWYTLVISGRFNCLLASDNLRLLVPHKKDKLEKIRYYYSHNPSKKAQKYPTDIIMHRVVKVESLGVKEVYNLTAGLSHTYLANNIITHNTANNKESNFQSAKTLLYAPKAYNIHELPNVYDKKGQGRPHFAFFYPAYMNRAGCMDEDGNSDVVAALLQILMKRYDAKYGADPTSVLRIIAEDPITPAEAIIKVKDAYFPVRQLTERAQQLDQNPQLYDEVYVGELITNSSGEIEFKPTSDTPIRTYPVDNSTKGALEVYQMPEKDRNGKVFGERYIIGVDPYDNDQAESSSLYSIFVFDLFKDEVAAEYTGRTDYANDAHEIVRKLCKFYNAKALYESNKKGLFGYMEAQHSTHLLADTPEYLRDKQMVKYSNFGSNAKGVNVNATINNFGNRLIKDYLNKRVTVEVTNDQNESSIVEVPILYKLKNRAFIEELIQFNPEMNFDRIRSFAMVMIYREEYIIKYGNNMNVESREEINNGYAGNDDFFTKNYRESSMSTRW